MCVTGWVLLGLEERVKVPEATFHVVVGRHLLKAHLREDLPELRPDLEQRVQVASRRESPQRVEVVVLELLGLPGAPESW